MDWIADPQIWIGLVTLTILEIVLGIDNIIFISILAGKLPAEQQPKARQLGLVIAMVTRIVLLMGIGVILRLTQPLFANPVAALMGHADDTGISVKDLVLIAGGLFLLAKSTHEIHAKLEGEEGEVTNRTAAKWGAVITQLFILNLVFSIDSVVTAIGMSDILGVMIGAVIISSLFMLAFAGVVSAYVERHPTIKMLALAFLILIGVNLIGDGFGVHIPKGYTYFAMAFSVIVEMLNIKMRSKKLVEPVHLRHAYANDEEEAKGH
jgi:predicted tellurium resistance membrane protein TerC